jgi:hypothetical protein
MFWGKVLELTYDLARWIHYEKLRLPKPHYFATKTQKIVHIQLLCNYPLGLQLLCNYPFRNAVY